MNPLKVVLLSSFLMFVKPLSAATFQTEKWTTATGVPVVFYPAMEVPMLNISLAFAAGSSYDQQNYGLSALTVQMMDQGNAGLNATSLAQAMAETGAQYSSETGRDMVSFSLKTLTEAQALTTSTQLFSKIISQPDFPAKAFESHKQQMLMGIELAKESPEEVANKQFIETLYQNHPYAHPVNGTHASLQKLSRPQLLNFYKEYYVASNATLVLVGAIDSNKAHQLADSLTSNLVKGKPATPVVQSLSSTKAQILKIPFHSSQTVIRLGQMGITLKDPDYFPLIVGNYILGGGQLVSRLAIALREKQGLTYSVDSEFIPLPGKGPFIIGFSTKNKEAQKALSITKETLETFVKEGPSNEELEAAKRYLTGSFPLSLASNQAIASLLLRMAFYHLPEDYLATYLDKINAISTQSIKEAFKKHIDPQQLLLIQVGGS